MQGYRKSSTQVEGSSITEKPLSDFTVVKLENKSLLKVTGRDAHPFLQGLITNDVTCLEHDCTALYAQLLNIKGRALCDLILYKINEDDLLIEVDYTQKTLLQSVLKKYKIRKKVKIEDVSDSISAYAAFGCVQECPTNETDLYTVYRDPRLQELGWRLTAPSGSDLGSGSDIELYNQHRYRLGVGEGPVDHIPEKALPLECNLVLLNGVSFEKGCYIGQELTSRSHHTGVIRKRVMPIELEQQADIPQYRDVKLTTTDKTIGVTRGLSQRHGLALLRVNDVLKQPSELYTTDSDGNKVGVKTHRPKWWPDGVGVL